MIQARARWAGRGLLAALAAILLMNAAWVVEHCDELRPMGRGDVAPSLDLARVDGAGTLSVAALRGQVVLVDFWATWCGPCEATMPMLKRLHAKYAADGLSVLSVNQDEGAGVAAKVRAYARAKALPFPVGLDEHGALAARYNVEVLPTMVLVGRDGRVYSVHVGVPSVALLERALDGEIVELLRR